MVHVASNKKNNHKKNEQQSSLKDCLDNTETNGLPSTHNYNIPMNKEEQNGLQGCIDNTGTFIWLPSKQKYEPISRYLSSNSVWVEFYNTSVNVRSFAIRSMGNLSIAQLNTIIEENEKNNSNLSMSPGKSSNSVIDTNPGLNVNENHYKNASGESPSPVVSTIETETVRPTKCPGTEINIKNESRECCYENNNLCTYVLLLASTIYFYYVSRL